jgi:hypothetical protein
VPEEARTRELTDLIELLGGLVREVDSSLLDEWEKLVNPEGCAEDEPRTGEARRRQPALDPRTLRVLVRNALFRRVQLAADQRWDELGELDPSREWDAARWRAALEPYFAEFDEIRTDAHARGPALFRVTEDTDHWEVHQVLDDPEGFHEWAIRARVDLDDTQRSGTPALAITAVQPY